MEILALRLQNLRQTQNKTQAEVAKALHILPNAYQKYEYGQHEPKASILARLADYFGVSADYLLGRTDKLK